VNIWKDDILGGSVRCLSILKQSSKVSDIGNTIRRRIACGREGSILKYQFTIATYFASIFADAGDFIDELVFIITMTFADEVVKV